MASQTEVERHNINLSRQVWGELKLRSFQEGLSASELVAYLVEQFVTEKYNSTLRLPRYQPRNSEDDRLGRTVFFPPKIWRLAKKRAAQSNTSIAGLIDYLIRRYLGLLPEATGLEYEPSPRGEVVRVGEEQVYLGENPLHIDLKTGKSTRDG